MSGAPAGRHCIVPEMLLTSLGLYGNGQVFANKLVEVISKEGMKFVQGLLNAASGGGGACTRAESIPETECREEGQLQIGRGICRCSTINTMVKSPCAYLSATRCSTGYFNSTFLISVIAKRYEHVLDYLKSTGCTTVG